MVQLKTVRLLYDPPDQCQPVGS
uniref:Uncharacterized protein n=1 Tax=Anopheles albimanus TaxID=7167 RepID=A0A182FX92_ANOAL